MPRSSTEAKSSDTSAPTLVKSASHEKFATRWKIFETAYRGLSDFSHYIGVLEGDLDFGRRLESKLQEKTKEISALQLGHQYIIEGFTEKYKKWEEKEKRLVGDLRNANNDVRSLQSQVAELKRISVTKETLDRKVQEIEDDASRKAVEAVKEKALEVQKLKRAADGSEKRVKKLEGELSEKSTLLIGSQVQLQKCQADLEERRTEIGLENLSEELSVR